MLCQARLSSSRLTRLSYLRHLRLRVMEGKRTGISQRPFSKFANKTKLVSKARENQDNRMKLAFG